MLRGLGPGVKPPPGPGKSLWAWRAEFRENRCGKFLRCRGRAVRRELCRIRHGNVWSWAVEALIRIERSGNWRVCRTEPPLFVEFRESPAEGLGTACLPFFVEFSAPFLGVLALRASGRLASHFSWSFLRLLWESWPRRPSGRLASHFSWNVMQESCPLIPDGETPVVRARWSISKSKTRLGVALKKLARDGNPTRTPSKFGGELERLRFREIVRFSGPISARVVKAVNKTDTFDLAQIKKAPCGAFF